VKTTASAFLVGVFAVLLIATPAKADLFGADIAFLSQLVQQGIQAARQAEQAYQNVRQFASYVAHPGSWQRELELASGTIERVSNGADNVALARIDAAIKAAQEATQQSRNFSENPTLGNVTAMSTLTLQQAEAMNIKDRLNRHLQDMARMDQYQAQGDGELGNVSETFKGRILK